MHTLLAWFVTFNFINITWVFFRAKTFDDALKVLHGMFAGTLILPTPIESKLSFLKTWGVQFGGGWLEEVKADPKIAVWLFLGFVIVLACKNSMQIRDRFKPNIFYMIATILFFLSILILYRKSEFIYFNF
jgi:hypothetical protein